MTPWWLLPIAFTGGAVVAIAAVLWVVAVLGEETEA